MREDQRKNGKAREPRWGDLTNVAKHKRWRHDDLHQQWRLLLYDWADECRTLGTWESLQFRLQFGVARNVFDVLLAATEKNDEFRDYTWGEKRGLPTQPVIQKVAGALFMLTKNQTVFNAASMAGISKPTLQRFFPHWMRWLREKESPKHIFLPSGSHLRLIMEMYRRMGSPGAMCSTDGVHVLWGRCPAKWKWINTGEKKSPSRVYNISVGPNTEVFYVPPASFPGVRSSPSLCACVTYASC